VRFGCCVRSVEQTHILAEAGYDFCELPAAAVHPFEDEATALPALREIEGAPLRPESFNVLVPAQLPLAGPKADLDALRVYLRRAFPRMAQAGAALVVLGSGAARRIPDEIPRDRGLDQLADAVSVAAEEAGRAGLELALEPLNRTECNVFNTLAESQAFIRERGLKNVRLVADLHHIEMESEPTRHVVEAGSLLAHVQVADGGRKAPGGGGYDFPGFMRALREVGYDRRISAECQWDDLAAQAAGSLAFMRQQWEAAVATPA
jgi:D-psicose/D-tagatose/L-ribulose 3-epimerase